MKRLLLVFLIFCIAEVNGQDGALLKYLADHSRMLDIENSQQIEEYLNTLKNSEFKVVYAGLVIWQFNLIALVICYART